MDLSRIDLEFGEALRIARLGKEVTQDQLAEYVTAMGVKMSQATIGKIERGDRKVTVGEAQALSRALGLYQHELLGGISAASSITLLERLAPLRDTLKDAMHAFESGQTLVMALGSRLPARDQARLVNAVRESLEDVIEEYRRDQGARRAALIERERLDGHEPLQGALSESLLATAAKDSKRVGMGHPRARSAILDGLTETDFDG